VNRAATLLVALVRAYQWVPKPWGDRCRYSPTCSEYAAQSVAAHGAVRGSAFAVWRVLRCNPFSPGGRDPVPTRRPGRGAAGGMKTNDVRGMRRV